MPEHTIELEVDPQRLGNADATGFYVRAKLHGETGSHDVATLKRDSLIAWLRSRGGENDLAESVVAAMLGHPHPPEATAAPSDGELAADQALLRAAAGEDVH